MSSEKIKDRKDEIESLVVRIQNGEHDLFSQIYDIFVDPLYRYIYYRVKSSDAEDLLETVFLKVWEKFHQYKTGKSSFSSWIFRIAHNLIVDYYRLSKNRDYQELKIDVMDHKRDHNPIKTTENVLHKELLRDAMFKLKSHYQDIIVHKFINGLSNREIAGLMNKSEGSVRILQFRALKALKIELEAMGVDYNF